MGRRYYTSYRNGTNTCSIKFLPKAYIGNGVRITSDKNTVEFENKPMTGMKIEDYTQRGFRISHPNLPKPVWVDFDQLPLTRLTIKNGIIEDEITFVENIVNHRMQLIRTLDTEYIDLIYKEKSLEDKKDQIISITAAVPGDIYIGAQCEEGNEMIFLGLFYTKGVKSPNYWYKRDRNNKKYLLKSTPQRAFFAVPHNELSKEEEKAIQRKYYPDGEYHKLNGTYEERQKVFRLCEKEKAEALKNSTTKRYKLLNFAVTSKRIKKVIVTKKSNEVFKDESQNLQAIISLTNVLYGCLNYPKPNINYVLVNQYSFDCDFIIVSKQKNNIEEDARKHYTEYYNQLLEPEYYEDKFK